MESQTNYTMVGLFVVVASALLLLVAIWLSVGFHHKEYSTYAVFMNEPVSGLSVQSSVKFNGVTVGYVSSIALNRKDPKQVRLLLSIEKGTPITTSTTATLMSQGITGLTYIGMSADTSHATLLEKAPGQPYPVIPSKPSLLVQLDAAVRDATENFKEITKAIKRIFDKKNAHSLQMILSNLDTFSAMLKKNSTVLEQSIKHTNDVLIHMDKASKKLPGMMNTAEKSLNAFKRMSINISSASGDVKQTMTAAKSAMKTVSDQAVPSAVELLQKLELLSDNMNQLASELKRNPAMLIRGKAQPALGPGEK